MNKVFHNKIFIFLAGILLFSCKKETDEIAPKITFNVGDTIHIKAYISDETQITSASVIVVDENRIPVYSGIKLSVTSPTMVINTNYVLDDIHLESNTYYLLISASDGKNDSRLYQRINIVSVPKVLKKIFVATSTSPYETHLSYVDSAFNNLNFYHSFTGDCIGISTSNYFQQVFLCGNYSGSYSGIDLKDHSFKFNFRSPGIGGALYFSAFYDEDKNNYVATYDDEVIKGYDYAGNILYRASANDGYYARKLIRSGEFLIAEEKRKTSPERILVSFYSTGIAEQQKAINQDVVEFCEKEENSVFVFGNTNGQGTIQLYERLNNNLWNPYPYSLASGSILSAVKIDADTYLIGHSNGTIYKYQYQNKSLTTFLSGYTAVKLRFDQVSKALFIAESNRISSVDYTSKAVVNTITSSENILDISLLYNR
jgi:hypothetical protein